VRRWLAVPLVAAVVVGTAGIRLSFATTKSENRPGGPIGVRRLIDS
jgi:hypothetical protein